MNTLKRIFGILLVVFGLLFVFRIPGNWHSTDPKAHTKVGADIFLIVILCGGGTLLLAGSRKKQ